MIIVDNFSLSFGSEKVLKNISFTLQPGRPLAIIGESGAGKTSLAHALMGMSGNSDNMHSSGTILCDDFSVTTADEKSLRSYRGNRAALVVQHLADVLNPQLPVLEQVIEAALVHRIMPRQKALEKGGTLLEQMGIAARYHACYPKQFSGGQVQRIMLAMALINNPALLILDEPTAALDPETRGQLFETLADVGKNRCMLLITHDFDAVLGIASDTAVLYGGSLLEIGTTQEIVNNSRHPYTRGLLRAAPSAAKRKNLQGIPGRHVPVRTGCVFAPRCTQKLPLCEEKTPILQDIDSSKSQPFQTHPHKVACNRGGIVTVLEIKDFTKQYNSQKLLRNISLRLWEGETVAVVGKSGSGKSTLIKMIMGIESCDAGEIILDGVPGNENRARFAEIVGFVSQHPGAGMSPRFTVADIVAEPLDIAGSYNKEEKEFLVKKIVAEVRLPAEKSFLERKIHGLSGGELQRIAIARALVRDPKIVIADEPTSALDVSVQAKIMKLLLNLQERKGLALLIVTHDIELAYKIADKIYLLEAGKVSLINSE